MKSELNSGFFSQLGAVWNQFKTYQKLIFAVFFTVVAGLLSYTVVSSQEEYVPLYAPDRGFAADLPEVSDYLESQNIHYRIQNNAVMVPAKNVHQIRMDLAALNLPKNQSSKGYELFDSSAWIKGEKELQIAELRALKDQLEGDIAQYDNIRAVKVNIDIVPPRLVGAASYKAKASVILSLMPGARLTPSQLRSITYHVSGAVKGLTPNMVAILDTRGRLYQGIDIEGTSDSILGAELILEEQLKRKIDAILSQAVGEGNYYSSLQVEMLPTDEFKNAVDKILLNVLINRNAFYPTMTSGPDKSQIVNAKDIEAVKKEIDRQIQDVLKEYQGNVTKTMEIIPFDFAKKENGWTNYEWDPADILYLTAGGLLLFIIILAWIFALLNRTTATITSSPVKIEKDYTPVKAQPKVVKEIVRPDLQTMIDVIQKRVKSDPQKFVVVLREWMHTGK